MTTIILSAVCAILITTVAFYVYYTAKALIASEEQPLIPPQDLGRQHQRQYQRQYSGVRREVGKERAKFTLQ